jgi:transposase-like protein
VEAYLTGEMGSGEIHDTYGVSNQGLYDWVRLYQTRGPEGLHETKKWRKYAPETKVRAVEEYLSGTLSLREVCAKYDVTRHNSLLKWIKQYNGHKDFKQPNAGGAVYMAKGRETTLEERIEMVSHCIAGNKDYGATTERFGVSYQQIYCWVRKYERGGPDGLVDRRGKRKGEASMNEVDRLRAQLKLKEAENQRLQMENELLKKLEEVERRRSQD